MPDIEWRQIAEAPEYAVSRCGSVRRTVADSRGRYAGRVLKPALNTSGYPHVSLTRDGRKWCRPVHVIVAAAYLGERPSPLHHVAHADGDRLNPHADNLRYATAAENEADKRRHGTAPTGYNGSYEDRPRGTRHSQATLTEAQVRAIAADQRSQAVIAAEFGCSQTNVSDIKRRRIWAHLWNEEQAA